LPYFVHPAPEQALIVGIGGGATSGAIAQHVRGQVSIVELSEGMVAAARMFADYNQHVLDAPHVRLIVADGRNYSLLADDQYDVSAADTIYPLHINQ
jgi:spermidine synthase